MKVTQEKLPASQIGLEIEIPPEMSKKAYDKVIKEFSQQASIPGFRKGKVPRPVLLQRLGISRIKAAAVEELIQDCLEKAIEQEKIDALGNFRLRSSFEELVTQFEPGQPLTFSASADVPPEVKLSEYKGLQVKAEEIKYDPADLDKFLQERRSEQATLIPVEGRPAQLGDIAVIDYTSYFASEEGESSPIPGGQAENFQLELSEGRFLPGLIDGIVAMNPGETKEVSITFPEDYASEEFANKSALFTIRLKELKEKELPELDDDFAQAVSEFQTLDELRESIESQLKEKAEQEFKTNKRQALLQELIKRVEVELPETMISREIDSVLMQAAVRLGRYGIDVKQLYNKQNMPQIREQTRPEAINKLKLSLALKELTKLESLAAESAEIEARIAELKPQLSEEIDPEQLWEVVKSEVLQDKALDWLEEHAVIELVPPGSLGASAETDQEESPDAEEADSPATAATEQAAESPSDPEQQS